MTEIENLKSITDLRQGCLNCRKCSIGGQIIDNQYSSNVFTKSVESPIMVVGQNPGRREIELQDYFVGPSGKFFDEAIKEVLGIDRSALYITNTVKCFTPNNREPSEEEIENCRQFLDKEIELLKPKVIVTLGNPALKQITGFTGITKRHGQIMVSLRYKTKVLPLYHPSPLNTNKPEYRKAFFEDLKLLKEFLP